MKNKKIIIIAGVVLLSAFAAYRLYANWNHLNGQKAKNAGMTSDVAVSIAEVKRMSADRTLKLVGALNAESKLNITAETSGKITALKFDLGQYKTRGSVIVTIDDKLKQLAVQSAQTAFDKAKKDFARTENLYKGNTASEKEYDDARTAYENARIQLEQAQKQLSYTSVEAPINGYITEKMVEQGSFVNIGTPIASIVDISRLKARLNVSESNAYFIKPGAKAIVTTEIFPDAEFPGKVSFVSPSGDETHNYPVEIEIPNNAKYQLKSGTFVNVSIALESPSSLFIPREALQGSVKDAKVYTVENGKAKLRSIVVGSSNDAFLEVVSGLKEGDKIVVAGQINLADGKEIKIINN